MKVYVLVHKGEVKRFYNIRTLTLQEKLTSDCIGDYHQISGLLSKWGKHRDERYKMLTYSLRLHKPNKKGK